MQNDNILDLDEFDIKNKIGKGGFAVVYTVTKKSTNEIFAAKILQNAIDDISCDQMLSISHEVNIMSKLNHPSILKFYGYSPVNFENQKNPIILTEFAPNGDLKHIIQLERQSMAVSGWDDTKKLIIIYGIASGMSYLHKNDIIHRDLKPENILMDNLLFPKISDFGLSKITQSGNNQTMQSNANVKGTPIYIAPEIWETQKYGKEGDVYSFSLILYEIMTNEVPFKDIFSISQVYVNIVVKGKRPDFTFPVPNSYRQLIEKCWSYDPRDRPTFDQIITQLKNDEGFITDSVDREDYRNYIDYIEQYQASFDQDKKILKMKEIESSGKKTFQLVTIDQPPLKVTEEDETVEVENNVDDSRKEVKDEDEENNFVSIDKGEDEETAESLFERGKKHYFEALRYLMMAKRKGCQKSSEFLKMHFKDQPDFDEHESESSAQPIPKQYKFEAEKQQNKEEVNKEELNKEEVNKEELNKEELNKEEVNKEELNKEELNKEELNKEELNKEELNKEEVNKDEVNKDEVNKEEVNKDEVIKEDLIKDEVIKEEPNIEKINKDEERKDENGFSQFFSSLKSKIKLPKKDIKFLSSSSQDLHEAFINELKKRLQEHPPVSGRHRAILLCTGSFCPVHNGHLRLLNTAAKFLSEEHKIDSLFGILSPSSDDYVLYRLGSQAIPLQHRYETLKLACAENNKDVSNLFIMPDLWEGSQPKFVDFPEVREHFVSVVKRKFWKEKVDVLYVCGGDLFMKIQCYRMKGYVGIARPGFDINIPGRIRDGVYACNDKKYTGCYSDATMAIKMAKENGESIKGLTYDSVADYLHDVVHWI